MRMGQKRFLLKRAYEHMLPEEILESKTKGLQAADWHESATASLASIKELLNRVSSSQLAARFLDLGALNSLVENWPECGWETPQTNCLYRAKLLRGLSVGAFILHMEG
jgi:asparagine synthase (glutamine-hydrolysing)